MKKAVIMALVLGAAAMFFAGCAGDDYNSNGYSSYDHRSSYDRKIDYEAHEDVQAASSQLSAQDISNLNHLK